MNIVIDKLIKERRNRLQKEILKFESLNPAYSGMFDILNNKYSWRAQSNVHDYSIYKSIPINDAKSFDHIILRSFLAKTLIDNYHSMHIQYTLHVNTKKLVLTLNNQKITL